MLSLGSSATLASFSSFLSTLALTFTFSTLLFLTPSFIFKLGAQFSNARFIIKNRLLDEIQLLVRFVSIDRSEPL